MEKLWAAVILIFHCYELQLIFQNCQKEQLSVPQIGLINTNSMLLKVVKNDHSTNSKKSDAKKYSTYLQKLQKTQQI